MIKLFVGPNSWILKNVDQTEIDQIKICGIRHELCRYSVRLFNSNPVVEQKQCMFIGPTDQQLTVLHLSWGTRLIHADKLSKSISLFKL